ncbi:MAG TPA: hypothetical protein VKE30_01680 [Chthoniobacterales bacterium]|nr:hypothetical protein [Chthoniobacterales bacterium]
MQRTASCGEASAMARALEKGSCRSKEAKAGQIALTVTAQAALKSGPEEAFASGGETGP